MMWRAEDEHLPD